jgi:hypothetical protein
MQKDLRILDLSLTYHWYDMIASGVKKEEYRELKEFYFKRLNKDWHLHLEQGCYKGCNAFSYDRACCARCKEFVSFPYDTVRFHRGQGGKTSMLVECKGIRIGYGDPEWGAPVDSPVFIISLGNIIHD